MVGATLSFVEMMINTEWYGWCNVCIFWNNDKHIIIWLVQFVQFCEIRINTDLHGWCQHVDVLFEMLLNAELHVWCNLLISFEMIINT